MYNVRMSLKGRPQTREHIAKRVANYTKPRKLRDVESKLFNRIMLTESGCWQWLGSVFKSGYAQVRVGRRGESKLSRAHRVSYETFIGPIPERLVIDHLCKNKLCINPDHLEAVTQAENISRHWNRTN